MNKMLKGIIRVKDTDPSSQITQTKGMNDFLTFTTAANIKKYLPHKSLYSKTLKDEIDVTKIYYGKCTLYLYKYISDGGTEAKMYYLKILNYDTKKQICDISISQYIYKYLKDILDVIPTDKEYAQIYYICFAGRMEKKKYSYNCRLRDSRLTRLEKVL